MTQRRSAVGVGWMAVGKTAHYFIGRGKALCKKLVMQSNRAVEPDDVGTGCCEECWYESQAIDGDMIHAMKVTGRLSRSAIANRNAIVKTWELPKPFERWTAGRTADGKLKAKYCQYAWNQPSPNGDLINTALSSEPK